MSPPREFHDAKAFLNALFDFGRGAHDWHRGKGTYAFRGQARSTWSLTPTRFREYAGGKAVPTAFQQAHREREEAKRFFDMADQHGLQVPEDSQQLRHDLERPTGSPHLWPEFEIRPLLGLAQHHGLPTRLLDWSRSPRVAAYFAAVGAAREEQRKVTVPGGAQLSVWVLDLAEFRDIQADPNGDNRWGGFPFWLITTPGFSNLNLVAQKGCFTLYDPTLSSMDDASPLDVRPLEEVYERGLVKLSIGSEHAGELLWLLDRDDVSAAALFPGYRGVALALEESHFHLPVGVVAEGPIKGQFT